MNNTRALCLLFACVSGCSAVDAPTSASVARQSIVGGVKDVNDPSVVLVIANDPNGQSSSLCTGEVISPHVVLTAAHCVDPAVVGSGEMFQIFLGSDYNNRSQVNNPSLYVTVRTTDYDHQFNTNSLDGGHDVGVVITSTAMSVAPLPLNRLGITDADQGASLRIIGYGITSGNDTQGTTAGTKRQTTTTLDSYDDMFINFGDAQHGTCEGDSGGPAFLTQNGSEVIAGITSFGPQGCTGGSTDTRIDAYLSFVDAHIEKYDPGQKIPSADMAQPPDMTVVKTAGMTGTGAGQAATDVGAACKLNTDCQSGACAFTTGNSGYCTAACSVSDSTTCPAGLTCQLVDTSYYCVEDAAKGCAVGGHRSGPAESFAGLYLLLAACALAGTRRSRSR